jgi:hypothetical protein
VKNVRTVLKFFLDDLKDVVSRWAKLTENDEEWEEIFGHVEFRPQKHISEKIGKKLRNGGAPKKNKIEKEKPKRMNLSEADIMELEKNRDVKLRDAKVICDIGFEVEKLRDDEEIINAPKFAASFDKFHDAAKRLGRIPDLANNDSMIRFCRNTAIKRWLEFVTEYTHNEFLEQRGSCRMRLR